MRARALTNVGYDPIGPVARALSTGVSRVRTAPAEKAAPSTIVIASPRRGNHCDIKHPAALRGRATSSITIHPAPPTAVETTMGVPLPPGRVHSGPPSLGVSSKGLISESELPGRSRPCGPTAIHFFGPFDTRVEQIWNLRSRKLSDSAQFAAPAGSGAREGSSLRRSSSISSTMSSRVMNRRSWVTTSRVRSVER